MKIVRRIEEDNELIRYYERKIKSKEKNGGY